MKKRYLAWAGIASAAILIVMFSGILLTGSFTIFPSATIDPISNHAAGDLVVITGKTNLDAGTRLTLKIISPESSPGERKYVATTDAFIVRGGGMENIWSSALDTSAIPPGEYQIRAYQTNETAGRGSLLASSTLRLTNTSSDPAAIRRMGEVHKIEFIRINRPGTMYRGEKILISGTTNLPNDTVLLYVVIQQSNTSVFAIDPKTREPDLQGTLTRSGLISVIPGDDGLNHWSFAIDSSEFIPDKYEIIVTPDTVKTEDVGKTGTFGTADLTVLEADISLPAWNTTAAGPCQAILIDALPGTLLNQKYTITGTTSLPPGTELLFQVTPAAFDFTMNENAMTGSMMGAMGDAEVIGVVGNTNTWSADVDLSQFPSNEYVFNVSNDRIDLRTYTTIYGNVYCARRFNLSAGVS